MSDKIYIQKTEPKKADAFRVTTAEDIPENLREAIRVATIESDDQIPEARRGELHVGDEAVFMDCRESEKGEIAPLGRVIRFEQTEVSDNCPSGINAWAVGPEAEKKRFIERDGEFFQKPVPTPAAPISEAGVPDWLNGAPISQKRDGSFTIQTDWGESSGKPDEAYWVRYGTHSDGSPDANILTKSEQSFDAYSVCTPDGENICTLRQFDDTLTQMREQNPDVTFDQVAEEAARRAQNPAQATSRGHEFDDILAPTDTDGVTL